MFNVNDKTKTLRDSLDSPTQAHFPPKPSIPFTIVLGFSMWGFVLLTYDYLLNLGKPILFFLVGFALFLSIVLLSSFLFFYRKEMIRSARVLFFVLCLMLPLMFSSLGALTYLQKLSLPHDFSNREVVVEITSDKTTGEYGTTVEGKITSQGKDCFYTLNLSSLSQDDCEAFYYGNKLQVKGSYSPPTEKNSEYLFHNNLVGTLYISAISPYSHVGFLDSLFLMRKAFSDYLDEIPQETNALLYKALLLGERTDLFNSDFYQEVKSSGLAHLVAISGAHLVIVASVLLSLAQLLRIPRLQTCIGIALLILIYVVFSGFSLSCLRAAVMSIVAYSSIFGKRRSNSFSSLGLVISFFIALEPTVAFSISFALSVLATLGIILFSPLIEGWISFAEITIPKWVIEPLVITLCATILTAGLSCSSFSQFSLIAPLANIIATLYIPLLMGVGFLGCFFGVFLHTPIFTVILSLAATPFCFIVKQFSEFPYSAIPVSLSQELAFVLTIGFTLLLWRVWPSPHSFSYKKGIVGLLLGLLLVVIPLLGQGYSTRVVMLDVGQGDAFLIQSKGKTVLIDTGNKDTKLLEQLARAGVYHLDTIVITHPDDDHCGSLDALKGVVPVNHLYVCKGLDSVEDEKVEQFLSQWKDFSEKGEVEYLSYHHKLLLGTLELLVVNPVYLEDEGGNQDSICFLLSVDGNEDGLFETKGLFVGDAESETVEEMLNREHIDSVDILKVGHHGSKKSLSAEILKMLNPKIALISVGAGNRFGHPSNEALSLLEQSNVAFFRTDEDGMVVCNFTAQGISVECLR